MDNAAFRLVTYGTLSPGESNYHEVSMISGTWTQGFVRGHRFDVTSGAASGFPGFVADASGPRVPVWVLCSAELPEHWARLDEFEGEGYQRATIEVATDAGLVLGQVYLLK